MVREGTLKGIASCVYVEDFSRRQDVCVLNRYINLYQFIGVTVFPAYPKEQVHPPVTVHQPVNLLHYLLLSAF